MRNVLETLRSLDYFVDNEFLQKYALLVEQNTRTRQINTKTHKHHIIPKSWYKLCSQEIDNTRSNLVNLPYRTHILAHYYLCLCTEDPFKYANELAMVCLLSSPGKNIVDKALISNLPMYNNIYEDYMYKLKTNFRLYD